MKYDKDYFIAKFEAISEEKWITKEYTDFNGKCCAMGHCGARYASNHCFDTNQTIESLALSRLSPGSAGVAVINDGDHPNFQQTTPKQRVLAWLRSL